MSKELIKTVVEIEVTETAKCTCGWCGGEHVADLMSEEDFNANRLKTTGHASDQAASEGAQHIAKISGGFVGRIKPDLQRRRTYTFGEHIVTIKPQTKSTTKSVKQ